MSRMATNEYIGAKRRLYATADRGKRIKMLDEVCETTGYERKYANRLLTGSRKFRERKGRGKTYGEEAGWISTEESASVCGRRVSFLFDKLGLSGCSLNAFYQYIRCCYDCHTTLWTFIHRTRKP